MKKVSPIIQCSLLRWLNEWKRWRDDYDNRALRTNTFFQNFIVTFLTSFAVLLRRFWFYLTFIVFLDLIRRFSTFSMFLRPFSTFLVVFETSLCHFSTSFRRAFAEFFSITPSRLLNRCIDFAWRANCQNQNCCQSSKFFRALAATASSPLRHPTMTALCGTNSMKTFLTVPKIMARYSLRKARLRYESIKGTCWWCEMCILVV